MPTLRLTDDQAIELIRQLPPIQQEKLFEFLLTQQWSTWVDLSRDGEAGVRMAAAKRGRDWDVMTEDEREVFIDDLVHEDRQCTR